MGTLLKRMLWDSDDIIEDKPLSTDSSDPTEKALAKTLENCDETYSKYRSQSGRKSTRNTIAKLDPSQIKKSVKSQTNSTVTKELNNDDELIK